MGNEKFQTTSIDLSSFLLAKRIKLLEVLPHPSRPGKFIFVFKNCPQMKPLLTKYYNGQCLVNLRKFLQSRTTIFEYIQIKQENVK